MSFSEFEKVKTRETVRLGDRGYPDRHHKIKINSA